PVLALVAYNLLLGQYRLPLKRFLITAVAMLIAFITPVLPFTIYIYRLTGNPLFPAANTFFQSPYWPTHGGWDMRFGPHTFWESILWPVLVFSYPERLTELAVYSGRLSVGYLASIVGLILLRKNRQGFQLCLLLLGSTLLWSFIMTGNGRYDFYQEALAGVTIVVIASPLTGHERVRKITG